MSMNTVPERLAALRAAMQANGVDVYLIPVGDPHSSEYLPDHYTSLTYFSGFHGENSNFVVTMTESGVWADGRYFVQAEKEIAGTEIQLMKMGEPGVPTVEEYCAKVVPEGGKLGLCGLTASCALVNSVKKALETKNAAIKTLFLEDELWTEGRPALPATPAWILPKEYAGFSPAEKLGQLRAKLAQLGCTAQLVGKLDNLAWLLNLRAMDIECTPYAMAYCYVTPDKFIVESFGTIAAYGGNAAMMHYHATPEDHAKLQRKGFLLVDSGATYMDGTTDITRTYPLGELTEDERKFYTWTLQCHIDIAKAVWVVLLHHLLQGGAEITHQRAADAAGVQLIDLDAGLLQEAAVDADLTELVLDQNDLLAGKGLLDEFFDQSGLAGAQEAGKNINFGHSLNASFFVSRQSRRALARKILHLYYSKPVNGKTAFFKKKL